MHNDKYHSLVVSDVIRETNCAVSVVLEVPESSGIENCATSPANS